MPAKGNAIKAMPDARRRAADEASQLLSDLMEYKASFNRHVGGPQGLGAIVADLLKSEDVMPGVKAQLAKESLVLYKATQESDEAIQWDTMDDDQLSDLMKEQIKLAMAEQYEQGADSPD